MTWLDASLDAEQREVADLVHSLLAAMPELEDEASGAELAERVPEARAALIESGVWSIGMDDDLGGGGAPRELTQVALAAMGAEQPALAWAVAQAHAAALALAADPALTELLAGVVPGERAVCVVELDDPLLRLDTADGATGLSGRIGRLDPCGEQPAVVALDGASAAWVIAPEAVTASPPLRRTGFAGALTVSATVGASAEQAVRVTGIDADAIRASLQLGAAAIAAGLAGSAADAALRYSRERAQFGGPLTGLPTVRAALTEQGASAAAALSDCLDEGSLAASRSAAVLRDNCERALAVTASAVQSLGGYGYLREYGLERKVRDAVSLRAASGAPQAMRRMADRLTPA